VRGGGTADGEFGSQLSLQLQPHAPAQVQKHVKKKMIRHTCIHLHLHV